jgi:hypothetical protein
MKTLQLLTATLLSVSVSAQSYDSLDINNIRAGFNASGDLFYNLNTSGGHISTPANSIMYSAGNLWIGGLDPGGQVRMAAQTYRQTGSDFWPGPLDSVNVVCDPAVSMAYNRVWKLTCAQVDSFINYTNGNGPANYTVPNAIQTWPGNGSLAGNQAHFLAPFVDINGDQQYSAAAGDYPVTYGTQSLFYIYNDNLQGSTHTESGAAHLGVEIHATPYAFAYPWDDALMNTIFIHYKIIYRNSTLINNARIGLWSDLDLTGTTRSGSDSLLGSYFFYSQDDAAGIVFLNTPMAGCVSYDNNFSVTGNPGNTTQYFNYLNQLWIDGSPVTYGGNGYNGLTPTSWMFTGNPAAGTGWLDQGQGDNRLLGTTADMILQPGMTYEFDVAMVFAHDASANFASVGLMKQYMQQVKAFYNGQSPICSPGAVSVAENSAAANTISAYPNPAGNSIRLKVSSEKPQPYQVLDATGRTLLSGLTTGTETAIDISQLPAGMYIIRTGATTYETSLRFVKAE